MLVVVHEYLGAEDEVKLFDLHDVDILPEFLGNCNQEKSIVRKGFFLTKKKDIVRYCSNIQVNYRRGTSCNRFKIREKKKLTYLAG